MYLDDIEALDVLLGGLGLCVHGDTPSFQYQIPPVGLQGGSERFVAYSFTDNSSWNQLGVTAVSMDLNEPEGHSSKSVKSYVETSQTIPAACARQLIKNNKNLAPPERLLSCIFIK